MGAVSGLDSLSLLRSFHWLVGGSRCAGARHLTLAGNSVFVSDLYVWAGGIVVLLCTAHRDSADVGSLNALKTENEFHALRY